MRRSLRALLVTLLLTLAPAVCLAQVQVQLNPDQMLPFPSDPVGAMQAARERVASGNLDSAISGLETYVRNHPGEVGPERLLGDLYYRKTLLQKAEATYVHILSYSPADKETHNRLGSVYATENRIDDAIREFERSLPGADSVPDLVRLHIRRGDFEAYKHELEITAEQYPMEVEPQIEIGKVYESTGEPEVAERYFKRALDLDPTSITAMNGLGLSYMDEHQYSLAIKQFGSCIERDAYSYMCIGNMGATYLHMSQWAQAETYLKRANAIQPESAEALVNLGYLVDERGDWKRAIAYYVQAMTVYPYAPDAYINLGYTYDAHGLYQLAQAALVKGLAVAPEDGRLHFLLGDAYSRQGNDTLAAAEYRAAALGQNLDAGVKRAVRNATPP